jgi:hypothetical protein
MSTAFSFSTLADAALTTAACRSVGAHLAAKLECFGSDERTLTDELCDMLCIWLNRGRISGAPFVLKLAKWTAKQEAKNGADFALVVTSTLGEKYCLLQAKVFDSNKARLRGSYAKLKSQLINARNNSGSLAFLLVYVPSKQLDGKQHGFGSWEQGFCSSSTPGASSAFGATAIPVDKLLDSTNAWIDRVKKVPHTNGIFLNGVPFAQLLLELLVCLRGEWDARKFRSSEVLRDQNKPFLTLAASIIPEAPWEILQREARASIDGDF